MKRVSIILCLIGGVAISGCTKSVDLGPQVNGPGGAECNVLFGSLARGSCGKYLILLQKTSGVSEGPYLYATSSLNPGFSVPVKELDKGKRWEVKLKYENETKVVKLYKSERNAQPVGEPCSEAYTISWSHPDETIRMVCK